MATMMLTPTNSTVNVFPAAEVKRRLQPELQKIADQGVLIRPEWEPLLDSKRVVGTVLALADLFPFKIPPDKVVRKGGYNDVEEATKDMIDRIRKLWTQRNNAKASQ